MVAAIPVISWISVAIAGTALFDKFLKPKIPFYKLHIHSLPRLRYINGQWKTELPTHVTLFNENYVSIDVYAVSFDLFYSDWWDGSLQHLARVEDRNQQQILANTKIETIQLDCTSNRTSSINCSSTTATIKNQLQPVWQIQPRSDFDFQDNMYVVLFASIYDLMTSCIFTMVKQFWKGSGHIVLPSTGVAHLQVGKIPATVSLICDNVVNTFAMAVEAFECQFQDIQLSWTDLEETAEKTKQKATKMTLYQETGGFFMKEWRDHGGGDDDSLDAFRIVTLEDQLDKRIMEEKAL